MTVRWAACVAVELLAAVVLLAIALGDLCPARADPVKHCGADWDASRIVDRFSVAFSGHAA